MLQGKGYPDTPNARRMLDRDIHHLKWLGITIERSNTRPPVYTLHGGTPRFTQDDLHVLALIRDTFGNNHPQTPHVSALLHRLTSNITEGEYAIYAKQQPLRAPVQPAIDYSPYTNLIERLEMAISKRQILRFHYRPLNAHLFPVPHRRVEPYEIEYYERHFYFVAYSHNRGRMHDFRIDRIVDDETFQVLERLPPSMEHSRELVTFRYRLAEKLARGEISQRFYEQRIVQKLPNGDVIIEAKGRSDFFILRTLLKYADHAELLEPEWLRTKMINEVERMYRLYKR
jgi:predicted DNA-binding transcriptional regulator YafY